MARLSSWIKEAEPVVIGVDEGLRVELDAFRETFTTEDMREGTSAFLAKRTPMFRT